MDEETKRQMAALEMKIDAIYATTEKVRRYFLWTLIITIALVVLPAVGLLFAIPSFLSTYGQIDSYSSLDELDQLNQLLQQ